MAPLIGCVADDLTGATDLALILKRSGCRVVQTIGAPGTDLEVPDADAIVVALKSRTAPVREALEGSMAGLSWLIQRGCRQLFFKYCSTFDSTDEGNIGPVADAFLEALGTPVTIACPALPENGRTVYQGHLFVGDTLLSDSPMKDHPLTPMRDPNLVRVLGRQSRSRIALIPFVTVARGAAAIREALDRLATEGPVIAVVDAITDDHLLAIGEALDGLPLVTGGSGVAMGLPENFRRTGLLPPPVTGETFDAPPGDTVILAGSCSAATRAQVEAAGARLPSYRLDPDRLAGGDAAIDDAISFAQAHDDTPVLIYSSADPADVARVQERYGRGHAGDMIERAFARIAVALRQDGCTRFVIAGGETAGAVVTALGVTALSIGPEIDPGVPWTTSIGEERLALALKSGNFGAPDFFLKAWEMLQ